MKADNPSHLKGREEDVDRLYSLCRGSRQVNLVGESGAGKSALLRSGLVPATNARGEFLPIYLDAWGHDWEAGPRNALSEAIWNLLSEDNAAELQLSSIPHPGRAIELLERIKPELARTPLLIFDQFDDYQTRHR